jgi:hypothetical protein
VDWPSGLATIDDEDLTESATGVQLWLNEVSRILIACESGGLRIFRVDLASSTVQVVSRLERQIERQHRFLKTAAWGPDLYMLLEEGMLCLDKDGRLRWFTELKCTDAVFDEFGHQTLKIGFIPPDDWDLQEVRVDRDTGLLLNKGEVPQKDNLTPD